PSGHPRWATDQRHVLADATETDRAGLCADTARTARSGAGHRDPRQAAKRNRDQTSVCPAPLAATRQNVAMPDRSSGLNPADRRYTTEHEWIKPEGQHYVVGITAFAQDQLGDIVYVELPKVGDRIQAGNAFGVIESVKTASDLYAPVSGEVVEVNSDL